MWMQTGSCLLIKQHILVFYPCPHCIADAVILSQHALPTSSPPSLPHLHLVPDTHWALGTRTDLFFLTHLEKSTEGREFSLRSSGFFKNSKKRFHISFICFHYTPEYLANYFISSKIKIFFLRKSKGNILVIID